MYDAQPGSRSMDAAELPSSFDISASDGDSPSIAAETQRNLSPLSNLAHSPLFEKPPSYPLLFPKIGTSTFCSGVSNCRTPTFESRNARLVKVSVYSDTTHSFGGATDTGVAKVTMFMDVPVSVGRRAASSCGDSPIGAARDHTGTEIGGGGGMDGDAKAAGGGSRPRPLPPREDGGRCGGSSSGFNENE
eukprot:CAMPEP_0113567396 /NCGR_PEP_ID=MMETSP0015_2-20120614/23253_1 /TAXON_ID=2838 /ORGANISM="Odontella" /LENGTH=189 /DNA_ID=CAMNT_0000469787 /DNA_START=451 /DNA_END=1020 /DNA_ORIENTATION=+ /assembly_acc=CAM_ASM_000160